ncbi:MAG: glycosyltransferase family 39 protein [Bryobacterales bacterium]|nr:glycosyltransferase family 39 protein [Bryobacterales bacterium]
MKPGTKYINLLLAFLLAACVARFWLVPLSTSFWVDEMVTAFVVHYGPSHPSLSVAPQVTETIYYALPQAAERLFGFSEIAYRVPSVICMAISLFLISRLAARLIHPNAGWFVAFACLSLRGFNYEAADARPYGLGTAVFAASLLFLIRWMDKDRWLDGLLFAGLGSVVWRVHLIYWPFYAIFVAYGLWRLAARQTPVSWVRAGVIFALIGLALIPVALHALALDREALAHVIVPLPKLRDLRNSYHFNLVLICGWGAWLLGSLLRWPRDKSAWRSAPALLLSLGW